MGGRIWVESQVGVGSVFYFTAGFQVQANQPQGEKPPVVFALVEESKALAPGFRVLLADDSEDNRYLILSYLKAAQVHVDTAENGEIAVRMFRENHYDVVLMDVEMPVMDGYQAVGEIRRIEKESGATATPVMALTAHAFADMVVRGREAGFTTILTKPIRKVTLLEALVQYEPKGKKGAPVPAEQNVVEVEKGMEDVVPGYIEKRRAEVPVYGEALARDDFESIRKLAHKMKGTGSGYGFPMLTELGSAIEKAAIQKEAAQIKEYLERFALYLESIQLKYIS